MYTKKQTELMETFFSGLDPDISPVYKEIALHLSSLGYKPKKEKLCLSFKSDKHNKQIAKMWHRSGEGKPPGFALRFSACRGYSQRFSDIVAQAVKKYPARSPLCVNGGCGLCRGQAWSHIYIANKSAAEAHCGAYALEIPNITSADVEEIIGLITREHEYLLKHEGGTAAVN